MHFPFILEELKRIAEDDSMGTRIHHRALLLREICVMNQASHQALRGRLGLRSTSISEALEHLLSVGLIEQLGPERRAMRGRPRVLLGPNSNGRTAISFYIEHMRLCGGLVNFEDDVLIEKDVEIPKDVGVAEFMQAFDELIGFFLNAAPEDSTVLGIAFSPIGAVERDTKKWINCNRWPGVHDVDFKILEKTLGLPITIRRNLETILDYEIQTTKEFQETNVALFHWGYGIGSAYSNRGVVLETERGNYSGVGHVVVNPNSKNRCQCGALGCLEAEAAMWALRPRFAALEPAAWDDDEAYYELLAKDILLDDAFLRQAVKAVQTGLHNLCKMFSPDYVLFLSPFASNRRLVEVLKDTVERSFPDEIHHQPEFRVIGGDFRSSLNANLYPLFREEIRTSIIHS